MQRRKIIKKPEAEKVFSLMESGELRVENVWKSRENQLGERPSGKGREHPPRRAKKRTGQGYALPCTLYI
jgi:hypothetical protein